MTNPSSHFNFIKREREVGEKLKEKLENIKYKERQTKDTFFELKYFYFSNSHLRTRTQLQLN